MFLIILLILTTAAISGTAACFSVFGLSQIFSAAATAAVIMGISLEAGKLVTASFLYQHWKKIGLALKTYLIFAILGLMSITSIGIFGFLSAAYQKDTLSLKDNQQKIEYLTQEKNEYNVRLSDINEQIKNVPSDQVTKKIRLIKTLNAEKQDILTNLDHANKELEPLLSTKLTTEARVGPIVFVAKYLGKSPDDATFYLILIIMSVFDPLAVASTIATNFAIKQRALNQQTTVIEILPPVSTPQPETAPSIDHTETLNNISDKLDKMHSVLAANNKRTEILNHIRDIDN